MGCDVNIETCRKIEENPSQKAKDIQLVATAKALHQKKNTDTEMEMNKFFRCTQ